MTTTGTWQLVDPWNEHVLSSGNALFLVLHHLRLRVELFNKGIRLQNHLSDQGDFSSAGWQKIIPNEDLTGEVTDVAWTEGHVRLSARPLLPYKAIVVESFYPLVLLPQERLDISISLPLFVQVMAQRVRSLKSFETYPMRSTWFGESPQEGELCYILPWAWDFNLGLGRADIATTMLTIANESEAPIEVKRIKIPCHRLNLFFHPGQGRFFTDALTMIRSDLSDHQTNTRFPFEQDQLLLINPGKGLGHSKNLVSRVISGAWSMGHES